jgi:uncharacterized protein
MSLFAIADPHLGFGVNKPMDVFGGRWQDHENRLAENWRKVVEPGDTTIIAGDISWAMHLEDALPDLRFLDELPGRKILMRGNHDYWWTSLKKMEAYCQAEGMTSFSFLQNNCVLVKPGKIVCGTRGWILPDDPAFSDADRKIYLREAGRLRLSLDSARALRTAGGEIIACFHYPPGGSDGKPTLFTEIMNEYAVSRCIYGHIHGFAGKTACPEYGIWPGLASCRLVSVDNIGFEPLRL